MAQSVIGALRVNLGLDSAQFEKGAKRVQSPLKAMKTQFQAVAAVAAAAGAAISAAALSGARDIDKAAKSARRLDSSIGGFRTLELAADEAGVSLSSMTNDIQTIDREIASIGKSGNAERALDELGLSIDDLAGKDADEKIATIADRIKALGLTAGEATSVLRDLGVRNREMVLLMGQGGDVIRNARADIEDYGLAVSQVDSDRIEKANDAIGRLGLIGQYAGQQLAIELVPAMGRMAEAMTDSLREGGLLRTMIDGLASNIERLGTYLATAVVGFGGRFVVALVAAKVATASLSAALLFLRGALIRTGIGALIVGAGELVYWFSKLIESSGSFSEALGKIYEVGKAVFLGVGNTAWGLLDIMAGVASSIAAGFLRAFSEIAKGWDALVNGMSAAWNTLAESGVGEAIGLGTLGTSDIGGTIGKAADAMFDQAVGSIERGGQRIKDAGQGVAEAVRAATAITNETNDSFDDGADAANNFADALENVDEAAGGGGGSRALKGVKKAADDVKTGFEGVEGAAKSAFTGFVTGAKSAREVLTDLLSSFAEMLANQAFQMLWSGGDGFGGIGSLFGFANGTSYAPGGLAMVGERGPELVNLPRGSSVTPAGETARMMNGGNQQVEIVLRAPEGFTASQVQQVQGISLRVSETSIRENGRQQSDMRYLRGGQ